MLLLAANGSAASAGCVFLRLQTSAPKSATSRRPSGRVDRLSCPFLEPTAFIEALLKVFIMSHIQVAAPDHSPAAPTFTQAAVRFAVSFAALIGLSLLLAGL
jgi:hypothetical protein